MTTSGKLVISKTCPDYRNCPAGVTVKMTTTLTLDQDSDDIPENSWVEVQSGSGFTILQSEQKKFYTVVKDQKEYNVDFYVKLNPNLENPDTVTVKFQTNAIDSPFCYTSQMIFIGDDIKVEYSAIAANYYFTSTNLQQSPADKGSNYAYYQATVSKLNGDPIDDGFPVEWQQYQDVGVFANVNCYDSITATYNEKLTPIPPNGTNQIVRTETIDGVAELYILPKDQQKFFKIVGVASEKHPLQFGSVLLFDQNASGAGFPPDLNCPRIGGSGPYNLDAVSGNAVTAFSPKPETFFGSAVATVLFFLNENNFASLDCNPNDLGDLIQKVPKTLISVTEDETQEEMNTLFFVAGNTLDGNIYKSTSNNFYAWGSEVENTPNTDPDFPRPLPAPTVLNAGSIVNLTTIADGYLHISVPLVASLFGVPATGQKVTVTIYLNGTADGSEEIIRNTYYNDGTITASDMSNGSIVIDFTRTDVVGYDLLDEGEKGFYVEYYVTPSDGGADVYSQYVNLLLSTPDYSS